MNMVNSISCYQKKKLKYYLALCYMENNPQEFPESNAASILLKLAAEVTADTFAEVSTADLESWLKFHLKGFKRWFNLIWRFQQNSVKIEPIATSNFDYCKKIFSFFWRRKPRSNCFKSCCSRYFTKKGNSITTKLFNFHFFRNSKISVVYKSD